MSRVLGSALLATTLTAYGCGASQSPPPAPPTPAGQACAVGEYKGTGSDESGTRWTFSLTLQEVGPDLVGSYHWVGSDGSVGDEQVEGHADCAARRFDWQGVASRGGSKTTQIVSAHYTGEIGADYRSLEGGWRGGVGIPGRFSAVRR